MAQGSEKTAVIEKIFFERWDEETGALSKAAVTREDLERACDELDSPLSRGNFANFFKDIVRTRSRNRVFPKSVVERGYTARQAPSKTREHHQIFQFEPLPEGQTEAFADLEPSSALLERPIEIESLSLDPATRRLGRRDESWLTTVVTELRLLHTHLARESAQPVIGLRLLMNNVKLGRAEVDAVYAATMADEDTSPKDVVVTMEAKSSSEVLEEEQVLRGAEAAAADAAKRMGVEDRFVIPTAAKVVGENLIWLVEFSPEFSSDPPSLEIASQRVYKLVPGVPGIR